MRKKKRSFSPVTILTKVLLCICVLILLSGLGLWLFLGNGMEKAQWFAREYLHLDLGEGTTPAYFTIDPSLLPWNLRLVNQANPLKEAVDIEVTVLANEEMVDSRIYPDLQRMFDDARAAGVYPVVAAGYRTHEKQQSLLDERISEYEAEGKSPKEAEKLALEWVALPGTSEHELGLAVDINADGINSAGYEVYSWLDEHAHEYGFIQRYAEDKVSITGISNEDWHYRYVGQEAAAEMYQTGECLEEYLMRKYGQDE